MGYGRGQVLDCLARRTCRMLIAAGCWASALGPLPGAWRDMTASGGICLHLSELFSPPEGNSLFDTLRNIPSRATPL